MSTYAWRDGDVFAPVSPERKFSNIKALKHHDVIGYQRREHALG